MKTSVLIIINIIFVTLLSFSQTNFWQGDVTSNWHYSGNWSLNHIPTSTEDVIIPDVAGFNPIVYGDALCNNLTINSGAHLEVTNTISVGGDYDNNAGLFSVINQITFNGDDIQNVYSLDCETLILDKTDGELRFPSETSTCNNYDWEQGLYRVNGGTFIINDLVDDGIFGTISVTSGQLDIHQDEDQFIDLNCTFFMTGGECNIYGGEDHSWWSWGGDASVTMSGGVLDFKDNGAGVYDGYAFTENISGGTIRTTGDFIVARLDYEPSGGIIELVGPNDCNIAHPLGCNLFDLRIDKDAMDYIPQNYPRKHRISKPSNSKSNAVTATSNLDLNGDFTIDDGIFNAPPVLYVGGDWQNNVGEAGFVEGTGLVVFDGDEQVVIYFGETFYDLTIDNTHELEYAVLLPAAQSLSVNNDMQILDGCLTVMSSCTLNVRNDFLLELNAGLSIEDVAFPSLINIEGNWQNNNTSFSFIHGFNPGNSIVNFLNSSDINITSACPDGDFANIIINSTATINPLTDLHILDDFTINNGIFNSPSELYIGGHWKNNSGEASFVEGSGKVTFDGSLHQICLGETFNALEINKPSGILGFTTEATTTCAEFDWTQGSYLIGDGIFIINDLVDDGLYGDITVNTGGLLSITQGDSFGEYVDLNGNLTIDDGEVHIYGGSDHSYWTYNGDASITMTGDAKLYFEDVGVFIIENEPFTFNESISGGEIHTASNFVVERDNFTPFSSQLIMNGSEDAVLDLALGSYLSSLVINKTGAKSSVQYKKSPRKTIYQNSSKANLVSASYSLLVQGDFTILNGSFSAPPSMWVRNDWINTVGESAFIENTGLVIFYGAVDSEIFYDEVFYDLCNQKDYDVRLLRAADNIHINVTNDLLLNHGVFHTENGNTVEIANNVWFKEESSWWAGNANIMIAGNWDNDCTSQGIYSGFRAQNSNVTFNGMVDQYLLCLYPVEEFYNLNINNSGGMGNNAFKPYPDIRITNDLNITSGNWYDFRTDNVHEFFGNVTINTDGSYTDVTGTVNLLGSEPQSLIHNGGGSFDVLTIEKNNAMDFVSLHGDLVFNYLNLNTGDITMEQSYYLNHQGIFVEANADLDLNAGTWLVSDDGAGIHVSNGGSMSLNGEVGNHCVVTQNGSTSYYDFDVHGSISAEYTEFRYMSSDGMYIHSDGLVDPLNTFNNCIFSLGQAGGTYITIDSDQSLISDGVAFYPNTWSGNSNVRKTTDQGEITFTNFSGGFSGEDFDDDVFDRIHWDDGSREIALSIILHGPYNGSGGMTTTLNNLDLIPNLQPYNTSPWNYAGSESVVSIPNINIVDWILIEYRDAPNAASATGATTIGQQAAFLLNDGSVVDLDGFSNLNFPYTINDKLYVVIYHRNHLSVMSRYEVIESGDIYSYDFSSSFGQGHGLLALKNLGGGYYGMFSGDGNADGVVDMDDKSPVWSLQSGGQGYFSADYNMDSQIDNIDKNDYWLENKDNSSQTPN